MRLSIIATLILVVGGGLVFFASCSNEGKVKEASQPGMEKHEMPADWKFTLPKGDPAQGREVFVQLECYKCHEVKGETFPRVAEGEKGVGPELFQMASLHPVEYFAESVIDPNRVIYPGDKEKGYLGEDGKSKMPDYNELLTVRQVVDLATYLASLKEAKHAGH